MTCLLLVVSRQCIIIIISSSSNRDSVAAAVARKLVPLCVGGEGGEGGWKLLETVYCLLDGFPRCVCLCLHVEMNKQNWFVHFM